MKAETKKRIWSAVENKLNNGTVDIHGRIGYIRFNIADGHIGIDRSNNQGRFNRCPASLINNLTARGKQNIADMQQIAKRRQLTAIEDSRREREVLDTRMNETGFVLLAGENTDIVCRGTLRECRDSLCKVISLKKFEDRIGCWVIVDNNNVEVQTGQFDRDCYYC